MNWDSQSESSLIKNDAQKNSDIMKKQLEEKALKTPENMCPLFFYSREEALYFSINEQRSFGS